MGGMDSAALVVTTLGVLVAFLTYVAQQGRSLRDTINTADEEVRKEMTLSLATHRSDIEMLKRDSVRREELRAVEARMEATSTRLDAKMDRILEKLAEVSMLVARHGAGRGDTAD